MAVVSMKQLLEAGVHFGHQTRRWNPKMAEYIYMERNGIYIIDLQKTVKKLEEAYDFVRDLAANGQSILFVGTKKQAQEAVKEEAERVGMFYVNARWLGGMLTNFKTMRTRVDRLGQLKQMQEDGTFDMPSGLLLQGRSEGRGDEDRIPAQWLLRPGRGLRRPSRGADRREVRQPADPGRGSGRELLRLRRDRSGEPHPERHLYGGRGICLSDPRQDRRL